mmetsp:Transcript_2784/g.9273  ORF Transcript_2784/g.9273 Transcript_2784/m.9273 type:complete len:426 (+) Transcript_2784:204-1481(+)
MMGKAAFCSLAEVSQLVGLGRVRRHRCGGRSEQKAAKLFASVHAALRRPPGLPVQQGIHRGLSLEGRLAHPDVLSDSVPVVHEILPRRARRTVLQLHLDVGDRPQPQLALREGASREQMVLDREATATDSHLLAARGALRDADLHHDDLASLVLVHHQLAVVAALGVQLAEEHRGDCHVVVVEEIPSQQPPLCQGDSVDGLASDAERREEGLRDQPHRARDVDDPPRALLLGFPLLGLRRSHAEVEASPLREERDFEALEVGQVDAFAGRGLELAVSHQGEWRQRERVLAPFVREGEPIDVQRQRNHRHLLLCRQEPQATLSDGHAPQRLVRRRAVGKIAVHRRRAGRGLIVGEGIHDAAGVEVVRAVAAADASAEGRGEHRHAEVELARGVAASACAIAPARKGRRGGGPSRPHGCTGPSIHLS